MATLPPEYSCCSFEEIAQGYTEEQAKREAERCLNCGVCSECMQCVAACQAGAIDHNQKPDTREIEVGAVVLSPGFQTFDPAKYQTYQYANLPNVVTTLEFERILSASGPFFGHVLRISDGKEPKKIAFIQCVGSRDVLHHSYCSSVCCMYATKEAIIAKEHANDLEPTIFFMDIRAHGKDFDRFVNRAKGEGDPLHPLHALDHQGAPADEESPIMTYVREDGSLAEEEFDMVVLSVGLTPPKEAALLAKNLGIDLEEHGFCKTEPGQSGANLPRRGLRLRRLRRPQGHPRDGHGGERRCRRRGAAPGERAGGRCTTDGGAPRGERPPGDRPRIGVFVCHCGINIGGVVDVPAVVEYAKTLPNVVYADGQPLHLLPGHPGEMTEVIQEHKLNRVVVASCSPRTHEPLFQETCEKPA